MSLLSRILLLSYLFSLWHLSVAQSSCGPTGIVNGVSYDFSYLGKVIAQSTDSRTYVISFCSTAGTSSCAGYPNAMGCITWPPIYVAPLGNLATSTWSFIDITQPQMGAQLTMTGGKDIDDPSYCPTSGNTLQASVLFLCVNWPGDDSIWVSQYGSTVVGCSWVITVNSVSVCSFQPAPASSISGGTIFLIIVIIVTVLYCVGGVLFMKFARQKTGIELIPNSGFWRELWSLIVDGCKFSWWKIRSVCGRAPAGSFETMR